MITHAVIDIETHDPLLKALGQSYIHGVGKVLGVGIYIPERQILDYFDPDHTLVKEVLQDPQVIKIFHNGVYDLSWLCVGLNYQLRGRVEDTMTRATLIDSYAGTYSLDACCARMGVQGKNKGDTIEDWWKHTGHRSKAIEHLNEIPREIVRRYCLGDLQATWDLFQAQEPVLIQQDLLRANDIESRLYPFLIAMKRNGIRIDLKRRQMLEDQLSKTYEEGLAELRATYGLTPQIHAASYLQMIWTLENIPIQTTEAGRPSFSSAVLSDITHPVAQKIAHLRGISKILNTFIRGAMVDYQANGHLYPDFFPAKRDEGGTVTGRYSSRNPNLQNFPARGFKFGKEVRSIFIPEDDCLLGAFDYKQIEYRVFLHFAVGPGSQEAKQKFVSDPDTDYHQMTVDMMNWEALGDEGRHLAKNFNFGCPGYNTYVATTRGYVRAAKLLYDRDIRLIGHRQHWVFSDMREQLRITLTNGQQFDVTPEHPFVSIKKTAGELRPGDRWISLTQATTFGNDMYIYKSPHNGVRYKKVIVDKEMAYLMGIYLATGSLRQKAQPGSPWDRVCLYAPEKAVDHIAAVCTPIYQIHTSTRGLREFRIYSKNLAHFFEEHVGTEANKHVPEFIYTSPKDVILHLLAGYFDARGKYVQPPSGAAPYIQVKSYPKLAMHDIARLGAMCGLTMRFLKAQVNDASKADRNYASRKLRVYTDSAIEQVPFRHFTDLHIVSELRYMQPVQVRSIETLGQQPTVCLETDGDHTYEAECCMNHNSIYGLGARSFAERFKHDLMRSHPNVPEHDIPSLAKSLMDEYFQKVPFAKATCDLIKNTATRRGYVWSLGGRRQRMPSDARLVYKMVNYLIQGSAADILKKGQVDAWEQGLFDVLKIHATVHDENVFSIPQTQEGKEASRAFAECMANAYKLHVPIGVDTEIGPDWGHCKKEVLDGGSK